MPWVISLIIAGIIVGPSGFDILQESQVIDFLAQVGLVFLMFMAGLETNLLQYNTAHKYKRVATMSVLNGLIPFAIGFGVAWILGYEFQVAFLVGVIFISSSIAVVIPALEVTDILRHRLGQSIVSMTVILDITSLVLLSVVLQTVDPITFLPLPIFYLIILGALYAFRWAIPKIRWIFKKEIVSERDVFQQELQSILVILIGTVALFEIIGLHPIIAGFFAGVVLSSTITSIALEEKIRAMSYGIFIPIFFVFVGAQTDFLSLQNINDFIIFAMIIVVASVTSKYLSGYIGGRLAGFTKIESSLVGASSIPQLSTTLAVAFSAKELGLIDEKLLSSLVLLSIITTFIGPILIKSFSKKHIKKEISEHESRKKEHYG